MSFKGRFLMDKNEIKSLIETAKTYLGIELGSTRIKAVLIAPDYTSIASSDYGWENKYKDGYWTYDIEDVWTGLQSVFASLAQNIKNEYGVSLKRVASMGFSAMMHGYITLDKDNNLLVPFRTWRNTTTGKAASELTEKFNFNIPQRWSIAHLYQAMLNDEKHVKDISFLTTLVGYIQYMLTGKKVLGIGEASGMFPIDSEINDYNNKMLDIFDGLASDMPWKIRNILPKVLNAGEDAGVLTAEGAKLLDPTGTLEAGIPLCPPEGDAGTGMVATNAVAVRTGNVSAGTSIFGMIVLEKALSKVYEEIDMVTTPTGKPVAMVHCNNCTNEINAWATVFKDFLVSIGQTPDMNKIFTAMFTEALNGETNAGGLLLYNYLSGEPITGLTEGRLLLARTPEGKLNFANFMRAQLYSALATLKIGMDILENENVAIDKLLGHGGYFKTPVVGQRLMAAATNAPVSVMQTAGEGGAWGMAILAAYMSQKAEGETLENYLDSKVFANQPVTTIEPNKEDIDGFNQFMKNYIAGLEIEKSACINLK